MQKVIQDIEAAYNRIAEHYTNSSKAFNEILMHGEIVSLATKWGANFASASVLDVGCGPGGLMKRIEKLGAQVYGIDISENLLRIAASRGLANLTYGSMHEVGDLFPAETFDLVVSNYALHYLPPEGQELAIQGIHKILKSSGLLVYSLNHPFFMRGGYFEESGPSAARTADYFAPRRLDSWGKKEFGEELRMFRMDWPEIYAINKKAGFDVLELIDGVLPEDIDDVIANTDNEKVVKLIKFFRKNPFAVFVAARK